MQRAVGALVVVGLLVVASPRPALADVGPGSGDNQGWTDGNGVGATAANPGTPTGTPVQVSSGGGVAPVCTYTPLSPQDSTFADQNAAEGWGPAKGTGSGAWYRQVCVVDARGNTNGTVVWLAQPPPAVNPAALAQQALDYNKLPLPGVEMSPPANRDQLVNLETWLWVDPAAFQPVSASAAAGGVAVTTTAAPEQVTWDMGNGDRVICAGPGTPYDSSKPASSQSTPCSYTYRQSSAGQPGDAFRVTATVSWQVTWTATGVAPGQPAAGNLGVVTRSSTVNVRVAEAEATNTAN